MAEQQNEDDRAEDVIEQSTQQDEMRTRIGELEIALQECQRLAIERVKTADAAVKADVYAADALMLIAATARAALAQEADPPDPPDPPDPKA